MVKGAASAADHAALAMASRQALRRFSTAAGPDGGNLACVWAVRHLIRDTLGYWVTLSDNTDDFAAALLAHFGAPFALDEVTDGGIIVSPSTGREGTPQRVVGHIGLLGPGSGDERIIHSNFSDEAIWLDHYTVGSWRERFADGKQLHVLAFPIPADCPR